MAPLTLLSTTPIGTHAPAALLAADGLWLVAWWKAVLFLLPFVGWAWVVSKIYDKDTAQYYFKRRAWNMMHLALGVLAAAVVLAAPTVASPEASFWITWPISLVLLGVDLAVYAVYRNTHKNVPEAFRWSFNPATWFAAKEKGKKKAPKGSAQVTLALRGPAGDVAPPMKETPEYEVRIAAEQAYVKSMEARASQIDIMPVRENAYGVVAMVDGVRQAIEQIPAPQAVAVMDFFKAAAGLDVADRRRKQVGVVEIGKQGQTTLPVKVTSIGASAGMKVTLLIDPEKQVSIALDDLGLHPNQLEDVRALLADQTGLVLVAAPPDQGRTATLYALVRGHDAYTSNVQTIETEPQAPIEGVRQNLFDPQVDNAEHSTLVRSILRRDPDVVAIADMFDSATAKEVARADHSHTRIYLGVRADGPLPAIQLYLREVGDQAQGAKGLRGVVAQRLLRRVCVNCRVAFQPTPDMLKKLGLPAETKQLYRKGGQVLVKDKPQVCTVCGGSGYLGQVGAFAVHTIGKEERDLIASGDMTGLRGAFRQRKQQSIQTAALLHVVLGNTSVEEVLRVVQGEEKPKPPPATPALAAT